MGAGFSLVGEKGEKLTGRADKNRSNNRALLGRQKLMNV